MRSPHLLTGLLCGLVVGVCLSVALPSEASRNAGGTYSLPAGNPVVTGTVISSTWANNTLSDVASEMTNSLDRNGRGAMLAPLPLASGTVSLPGLTFSGDANTGIYRVSADDFAATVAGVKVFEMYADGTVTYGVAEAREGVLATQSGTNLDAVTATGNGIGKGVVATGGSNSGIGVQGSGGASNGIGVKGIGDGAGAGVTGLGGDTSGRGGDFYGGAPNGPGAVGIADGTGAGVIGNGGDSNGSGGEFTGSGTGRGVYGVGGSSGGIGVTGVGGATSGDGVHGTGSGTGFGGVFAAGTASTGGTRQVAVDVTNGDIDLDGVAEATSTTSIRNRLLPSNLIKAWGRLVDATPTVTSAFNVTSVSCSANEYAVTIAGDMADATYAVICSPGTANVASCIAKSHAAGTFNIAAYDFAGAALNLCAGTYGTNFLVLGAQ